jgi:hypothetical protein
MSDVSLLNDLSLLFPFKLGQSVRHRVDSMRGAGIVLGAILREPVTAIVRWQGAPWTFEVLEDLAIDDS